MILAVLPSRSPTVGLICASATLRDSISPPLTPFTNATIGRFYSLEPDWANLGQLTTPGGRATIRSIQKIVHEDRFALLGLIGEGRVVAPRTSRSTPASTGCLVPLSNE